MKKFEKIYLEYSSLGKTENGNLFYLKMNFKFEY